MSDSNEFYKYATNMVYRVLIWAVHAHFSSWYQGFTPGHQWGARWMVGMDVFPGDGPYYLLGVPVNDYVANVIQAQLLFPSQRTIRGTSDVYQ